MALGVACGTGGGNRTGSAASGQFSTTSLHIAATDGSVSEIEEALSEGMDVEARAENGITPLHLAAAQNSDPAVVELLLDEGADTKVKDWNDRTPLHLAAAQNSNPAVVELLLDEGADAKAKDWEAIRRCIWPRHRTPIRQWWRCCSSLERTSRLELVAILLYTMRRRRTKRKWRRHFWNVGRMQMPETTGTGHPYTGQCLVTIRSWLNCYWIMGPTQMLDLNRTTRPYLGL